MTSATQMIRRRRARKQRRSAARARSQTWTGLIAAMILLFVALPLGGVAGGALYFYLRESATLPPPVETASFDTLGGPTRLYDRSGQTLIFAVEDPLGDSRPWVSLDELPDFVMQATLLIEDPDFLEFTRFDPIDTVSRLWQNLLLGPLRADPSLTARLVRNAIAPPSEFASVDERTREIVLTAEINRRYSPRQVLEWHLNTNYYGNEAYGIEAAAQVYLDKSARDLTLDEAAMLASIATAPQFNPIDNELAARGRQADTLRRMLVEDLITPPQHDEASRVITEIRPNAGLTPEIAPDFAIYARRQTERILNSLGMDGGRMVSRGGLRVITTLDMDLYYQTECATRAQLAALSGSEPISTALDGSPCLADDYLTESTALTGPAPDTAAIALIDVNTGEIRTMIGPAVRAEYQPGPTLFPFVYFEGLRLEPGGQDSVFTAASMLLDIPRHFPGEQAGLIYQPANPDARFSGPVSLRTAAASGLLPPAVQIANDQGMTRILNAAHRMGVNTLDERIYHPSLLERGGTVSVLDMAYAYTTLATMGDMRGVPINPRDTLFRQRDPVAVLQIEDSDGSVLWSYTPDDTRLTIFDKVLGYLLNNVMSDSAIRAAHDGGSGPLITDRPTVVVNGLTGDRLDNWAIGYTPQWVVAAHLGNSEASTLAFNGYGLSGAATLWRAIFDYAHQRDNLPPVAWETPPEIVEAVVCERSGMLPNEVCPTRREIFIGNIRPTSVDTHWQQFAVNSQTGRLATANTASSMVSQEVYFVPPQEAMDWWRANGQPLPPSEFDLLTRPADDPLRMAALSAPAPFSYVRGVIELRGTVPPNNLDFYQISYGQGAINPQAWFNITSPQETVPEDGVLAVWDTSGLEDAIYTVELTYVPEQGSREVSLLQLRVDNTPPTVIVAAGERDAPQTTFRWPDQTVIPLVAEVNDAFAIDRVEFYRNEQLIGTVNQPNEDGLYVFNYAIGRRGLEIFRVTAYDAAGNRNDSADLTVEVQ